MNDEVRSLDLISVAKDVLLVQNRGLFLKKTLRYARELSGASDVLIRIPENKGRASYGLDSEGSLTREWAAGDISVHGMEPESSHGDQWVKYRLDFERMTRGWLLFRSYEGQISPRTHETILAFCSIVARAIRNTRIYERLRTRVKGVTALWKVGTTISSSLDLRYLLDLILSALRDVLPYDAAGIYLLDLDGERLTAATLRGYLPEMEHVARAKVGHGLIGWAAKVGDDIIVDDVTIDEHYIAARKETRSEMVALLRRGNRIVGAFNVESDREHAYSRGDLLLLKALASQAAIAVLNATLYQDALAKKRLDAELSLAYDIQRKLLPADAPRLDGWEMAGLNVPAARVGGDYYDFIEISQGVVGISIADVSGKGVPASLVMATFRASLLAEVLNEYSIEVIFRKVNELLVRSTEPGVFVTAIHGTLEIGNGTFTYCNAGHVEPLLIPADGTPRLLAGSDIVLGSFPGAPYHQRLVTLGPCDILLFYTDGISEAMDMGGEEFGIDRLTSLVSEHKSMSAIEIRDRIYAAVLAFAADPAVLDDLTAVVVKRTK